MSSGVIVNPECQSTFQKLAEGKREYRYIIFKIDDQGGKEIVVEKALQHSEMQTQGDDYEDSSKAAYEEFLTDVKSLTDDFKDCRYAVFDFKLTINRQGAGLSKMDKILFLQICPDGASIKKKMVYASSASAIKSALGSGKITALQVSDESEMAHKEMITKLTDKYSDFR